MSTQELQEGTESSAQANPQQQEPPPPQQRVDAKPPPQPQQAAPPPLARALTFGSAAAAGAGAGGAGGAGGWYPAGTSGVGAWRRVGNSQEVAPEHGTVAKEKDCTYLRLCRWEAGPGGCCGCEGAGGAPKKARNPLAGDIICPTLPCSSLGLTEGRGLPTSPETRANWLGDMRPAWQGREDSCSQAGGDRRMAPGRAAGFGLS